MSNHNEDSLEPQYSPTLTRSTTGNRSREEERAITEHQVRGTHWTDEGRRRSTRTSGSRGATPVHRVVHDSENESTSSTTSERDSNDMDGPNNKEREPSDLSDLSLPPHPHVDGTTRSPPNRPPGAVYISPPPMHSTTVVSNTRAAQFIPIMANPVTQVGPIIGPYVEPAAITQAATHPPTTMTYVTQATGGQAQANIP